MVVIAFLFAVLSVAVLIAEVVRTRSLLAAGVALYVVAWMVTLLVDTGSRVTL